MQAIAPEITDPTPHGIAAAIARLITSGELAPGDRLPTVRDLAADLGISPATVSHAWQALSGVGLIISRGRSGSFVRPTPKTWLPPRARGMAGVPDARLDLSTGTPDPALLPSLTLALTRVSLSASTPSYLEVPVIPELEHSLRASWPGDPEGLTVVDGALDAISRSLEQVAHFGDRVIVEDPGYPPLLDLLDQFHAERVPVAMDEHGIRPDKLVEALSLRAAAVVLQPRAQNPTGVSMTVERAKELARILRTHRNASATIVIEDDHSGQISSASEVSLARWMPERVIHIRSFSKSHGPDLRIAAVGGPAQLVDRIVARRMLGPGWTSRMLQRILNDLLTDFTSIAEVSDARRVYHGRQRELADALRRNGYPAQASDGVNTWIAVDDERSAVVQLAAAGIRVAGGGAFIADPREGSDHIRVTVGLLREDFKTVGAAIAEAARA
ncbi:MAG: aminotransferase class I/II-fold pyridoxal phosphate-dependent enzyme [Rhodoglobus sp.]